MSITCGRKACAVVTTNEPGVDEFHRRGKIDLVRRNDVTTRVAVFGAPERGHQRLIALRGFCHRRPAAASQRHAQLLCNRRVAMRRWSPRIFAPTLDRILPHPIHVEQQRLAPA
jgi:hypothetical protein